MCGPVLFCGFTLLLLLLLLLLVKNDVRKNIILKKYLS
jgi:hypothetical protein